MAQAKNVVAEIIERLAALKPEQFTEPDMRPDASYHAVGEADDDIKRLFTLRNIACEEHNVLGRPIAAAVEKLTGEMKRAKNNKDKVKALQALVAIEDDPETLRIQSEMARKRSFHSIVDMICWLELRRQYTELADKPSISIRKNWTVGWCEKNEDEEPDGLFGTFDDRPEMPDDFLEFLRSQTH